MGQGTLVDGRNGTFDPIRGLGYAPAAPDGSIGRGACGPVGRESRVETRPQA
jgi:hypothetical protein